MGRLSARSNPTGLRELPRSLVSISVSDTAGRIGFAIDRLDTQAAQLDSDLEVYVIARAGNTSLRYAMGTVASLDKGPKPLDGIDRSKPLRFRILFHKSGDLRLAASIENLRTLDDSQSESMLPMEPAKLGERLWKLVMNDEGPVLQFNSDVFPSAAGAENFTPFGALVLPEALRHVMVRIADDPGCLEEDGNPLQPWASWLDHIGAERPVADEDEQQRMWCDQVVDLFCQRFRFASQLSADLLSRAERNG